MEERAAGGWDPNVIQSAMPKDGKDPGVGNLRRGDYMVHVFIERGKEFVGEGSLTVDPMVKVSCLGQTMYSTNKKDITLDADVNWQEHIFLDIKNIEKDQAEESQVVLEVMDKGFFKNSIIGTFDFDLSYIYFMKDHALLH